MGIIFGSFFQFTLALYSFTLRMLNVDESDGAQHCPNVYPLVAEKRASACRYSDMLPGCLHTYIHLPCISETPGIWSNAYRNHYRNPTDSRVKACHEFEKTMAFC